MYSAYGYIQPSGNVGLPSTDPTGDYYGGGINDIGGEWTLDLGFGGIWSHEWVWQGDSTFTGYTVYENPVPAVYGSAWGYDNLVDFYKIGAVGGNPKHMGETDIVERLVP